MNRKWFLVLSSGLLMTAAALAGPTVSPRKDYTLNAPAGWNTLGADQDSDFSWGSSRSGLIRVGLTGRHDLTATTKAQAVAALAAAGASGSPSAYSVDGLSCSRITYSANGQDVEEIFCHYKDGSLHRELRLHFEAASKEASQDVPAFRDLVKSLKWDSRVVSEP